MVVLSWKLGIVGLYQLSRGAQVGLLRSEAVAVLFSFCRQTKLEVNEGGLQVNLY